ncbi:MAG: SurA N-terminal domain-containing protein, partial [Methyloceanibacter sp.]
MAPMPVRAAAFVAALALAVFLVGGPHPATAQELSIVVLVNDDPISDYDIEQRERFLAITTQAQPSPELKKQATDMLIDERLQIQEGKKLGTTTDEADVRKILDDMASKNNLDAEGLTTALAKAGVNIKTLKDRIRAQIVWQDVVRRKFRRDVLIGDAEVDEALSDAGEE